MKDELNKKQQELKSWLKKLGLSQPVFAERVFYHINDSDNEEERKQFIERFKKAINRSSTDVKLIESYLDILYKQNEFLKLGLEKLQFYYEDDFNKKMKEISQGISERFEKYTN